MQLTAAMSPFCLMLRSGRMTALPIELLLVEAFHFDLDLIYPPFKSLDWCTKQLQDEEVDIPS